MKEANFRSDDEKLGQLLRESRSTPGLPPRFQENVWRRIESPEKRTAAIAGGAWLEIVTGWVLRPRMALAAATLLVIGGVGTGWTSGEHLARADAQARYLAAVAPNSLR